MNKPMYYFNRIIQKTREQLFNLTSKKIRSTNKVITTDYGDIILVTQLHKKAIDMALIALKSFMMKSNIKSLHIINDGSLVDSDISLLKSNFSNFKLIEFKDIEMGLCPKDGTWERLCYIAKLSEKHYVIQLDSDTITLNTPFEIISKARRNIPFIIGNGPLWDQRCDLDDVITEASLRINTHVQTLTEKNIKILKEIGLETYIRGCSAVTGFAKGSGMYEKVQRISALMERELGQKKWSEWGSEQVCCSIALSMCNDTEILTWPKYQNYKFPPSDIKNKKIEQQVSLIHFIGSNRFSDRNYEKLSKKFIKRLMIK